MDINEFNKKEQQIKHLLINIRKGDTSRIEYIFSQKFLNGINNMLKVIGADNKTSMYVFGGNGKGRKVGDIVGFKVEVKQPEKDSYVWDKLHIYQSKLKGLSGVELSCRKDDKGGYGLVRSYPIKLNRKPNGYGEIEKKRDEFSNNHKERDELSTLDIKKERESERTEKDRQMIDKSCEKLMNTIDKLGKENNAHKFEVYGLRATTINSGTRGRWSNSVGFGVDVYDKKGNKIDTTTSEPTAFTMPTDRLKSNDFYQQVSKDFYQLVEKNKYPLTNNINHEKGIIYIKLK